MARRVRRSLWPLLLAAVPLALLGLFFAYPLWETLRLAFEGSDAWRWAFVQPYVRSRLALAFEQALLSVALALAVAVPLAWLHHSRRIPWSRWHLALHAAPFVLPVFVVVFGLQAVLGRNGLLDDTIGVDLLALVGPLGAVALANAYYNYGFAARLLHAALERRPRRLEEAARSLGASPVTAFLRVTVPLLLPALLSAALLVFLFSFASFGVVLFLGEGEVATLETLIFENMGGSFPSYDRAAVLGLLQLGINFLLLAAYWLLRRRETRTPREPASPPAPPRGWHHALAWGALGLALLPSASVLVSGFRLGDEWSLEPLRALLDPTHEDHLGAFDFGEALRLTLLYALGCTLASLALALLLAYALRGLGGFPRRALEAAASIPLGTSSLLVGFGYVVAFGAGAFFDLRGTMLAVIAAHTLIAFPFTARAVLPALEAHDRRLDEAAATLGAPPRAVVARVHWPLLRAPLLVGAGMAAAMSLGDFGASVVLMTPETTSLTVWIHRHGGVSSFDPMDRAQARVLAAVLMILAAGAYLLVERFRPSSEGDL